jgi:zinc/manganese transport system substrate-binding protein
MGVSWLLQRISFLILAAVTVLPAVSGTPADAAPTNASLVSQSNAHVHARLLRVVVAENFWGSIVHQEAGSKATVTSIITNPNADPHSYEPTTADARLFAQAQYVVINGAGYDPWASKLLAANPVKGRRVLVIGDLIGKKEGDNPHLWYGPPYVSQVAARVARDLSALDRADTAYFGRQHAYIINVALHGYFQEINLIRKRYRGVPVGATESIFVYLASALGLNLITPSGFMKALSEGSEPTAQDKATFDRQVSQKQIKVLAYNIQNATPDVTALVSKARAERIPVVPITETLQPATASFQAWQLGQLRALASALHTATGR